MNKLNILLALLLSVSSVAIAEETVLIPDEYVIAPLAQIEPLKNKAIETTLAATESSKVVDSSKVGALIKSNQENPCAELLDYYREQRRQGEAPRRVICEPNAEFKAQVTPNDSYYSMMTSLHRLQMPAVWDLTKGSNQVVIAVVDTGINYNHSDLASNMWRNPGEVAGDGIDNDGNGYVDDIYGYNAINGNGNPMDDNGHGTHVAGTIGAVSNNGQGVSGLNWNVQLMGVKFLGSNGSGSLWGAVTGLAYIRTMKQRGVNVIASNNSWGGGGYYQTLYDEIARARDDGMLFIAAAGNESNNNNTNPSYPSSYALSNIISVAAINPADGSLASFSNYGASAVHIGAPGVNIASTYVDGGYRYLQGTSMACPHVAGAVALLKSYSAGLTMDQIKTALLQTATYNPALNGRVSTNGELNILGALASVPNNPLIPGTPTPTPSPTFTATPTATPTITPTPTVTRTPTMTPTPRGGSLTLKVVNDNSIGLAQVTVRLQAQGSQTIREVSTASDGTAVFAGLAGGNYTATFIRSGYTFRSEDSFIRIDGDITRLVTASRSNYALTVSVVEKYDASPLSGMEITVYADGALFGTSTTNNNGVATFQMPFGSSYRVEIQNDGYSTEELLGDITGQVSRIVGLNR